MTRKGLTLGPKSKSALIQKQYGASIVCNDRVTIAREMSLSDAAENLRAQMLRQAAEKTGALVRDGTSTATILAPALFVDGVRSVTAGASAIDIKRALDRSLKVAVDEIKTLSRPVRTRDEKAQVATISAHNDPTIGELVAPAMDKVDGDGVITVDESKTTETVLEIVEGMQFDRGYLSIDAGIAQIRHELDNATSDCDRDKLQKRLAKLSGGVAVIRVGAPSESEMKAKKEALEDAISATKAAVAEGIVPGGGMALLKSVAAIERLEAQSTGDERAGVQIFKHALEVPTRQIAENSAVDGGVVVSKMLEGRGNVGFDSARKQYVDLLEAGIVDPTKVVRIALENAVSVTGILLLTEPTMTEKPEPRKETASAPELQRPPGV